MFFGISLEKCNCAEKKRIMIIKWISVLFIASLIIGLKGINLYLQAALGCIDKARQMASKYLASASANTPNQEIFHLAITAYAMSLSKQKSRTIFDKLWDLRNQCKNTSTSL